MIPKSIPVGKYVSLGYGLQVRKSKNGTYTYYHNYREATTKKVKRRKLFSSEYADKDTFKQAMLMSEDIVESDVEKEEQYKQDKKYTLSNMKRYYFDKKVDEKHFELKKRYAKLSDDELKQNTNYKDKIYNVKKEENRFDKAFSEIYID